MFRLGDTMLVYTCLGDDLATGTEGSGAEPELLGATPSLVALRRSPTLELDPAQLYAREWWAAIASPCHVVSVPPIMLARRAAPARRWRGASASRR